MRLRKIPSSGEAIPAIGLGTWQAFDVTPGSPECAARAEVLRAFLECGGRLVDSSPMYGQAEAAIGACRERLGGAPQIFSATKVWTTGARAGISQMERSAKRWGLPRFDLVQVHNLVDCATHLATLKRWKSEGRIRYIGVTTSHGQREREMLELMRRERDIDFVQFSYGIGDRVAEEGLLPAAADHGKAVLVNLPLGTGRLFQQVRDRPLPPSAAEAGCRSWAQFFLKFVISHPAVTCAIPATSSVAHLRDDMAALGGPLPDAALRARMAREFEDGAGRWKR